MELVLQAEIIESSGICATLGDGNVLDGSIGEYITTPPYEGAYIAVPSTVAQTFETNGLRMTDDFEVTAIPYSEVTNPAGGKTATIAF